jgi:uncharacterized membrane protein YcaP (DUF421 family)
MSDWQVILLRSSGLIILILFLVRLMGKRQLARMTFFELVTGVAIAVIVAAISLDLIVKPLNAWLTLAVWVLVPALIYFLAFKYKRVRDLIQGGETVLIKQGKVMEDNLLAAGLTSEDLLGWLRQKNAFNVADVEFSVMEPTGDLSVLLKKDRQPVTPLTLGLPVGQARAPQTVMLDGVVMDGALTALGLNRGWLNTELQKAGVAPENVFIAQVDAAGQLYLDLFDDTIQVPQPKTKELTYVSLKKCQADCELFALGTKKPEVKEMYENASKLLAAAVRDLAPLLKK